MLKIEVVKEALSGLGRGEPVSGWRRFMASTGKRSGRVSFLQRQAGAAKVRWGPMVSLRG